MKEQSLALVMRDHQREAYKRALAQNLLVFYEQGLGKTLIGVELARARISLGPLLIVTKKGLVEQWEASLDRQQPNFSKHPNLTLTSYSQLHNLERKTYRTLILDESHLVKNHLTKRFKLIKQLNVDRKLFLTATPFDHKLSEIYWQLHLLEPKAFQRSLFKHVLNAESGVLPLEQQRELRRRWSLKFAPYIIRARMTEHNQSAKLKLVVHRVQMTDEQRKLYQTFQRASDVYVVYKESLWVLPNEFARTLRLRQISTYPEELNKSAIKPLKDPLTGLISPKVLWTENFLKDNERRKKTLVYSTMRSVVDYLAKKYDVKPNQKNTDDLCVGTLSGMATGIDLPHHEHTVIIDGDYSRILHAQAVTRFMRLTSAGTKTVHYLISSEVDHKLFTSVQNKDQQLKIYDTVWKNLADK